MTRKIITGLNIGISAIMTEHFFTFTLSSLPTTKEFFSDSEEKKRDVRRSYTIATILSIFFSTILSYMLKNYWGLLVSVLLCAIFIWLYERALRGEI